MAEITELTAATFDETVKSADEPVVVDFWAEWCAPCKKIVPILEEIADETAGKLHIAKLDVEAHPSVAQSYGVMGIPTLIVFQDGQEVVRVTGSKSKAALLDDFAPVL